MITTRRNTQFGGISISLIYQLGMTLVGCQGYTSCYEEPPADPKTHLQLVSKSQLIDSGLTRLTYLKYIQSGHKLSGRIIVCDLFSAWQGNWNAPFKKRMTFAGTSFLRPRLVASGAATDQDELLLFSCGGGFGAAGLIGEFSGNLWSRSSSVGSEGAVIHGQKNGIVEFLVVEPKRIAIVDKKGETLTERLSDPRTTYFGADSLPSPASDGAVAFINSSRDEKHIINVLDSRLRIVSTLINDFVSFRAVPDPANETSYLIVGADGGRVIVINPKGEKLFHSTTAPFGALFGIEVCLVKLDPSRPPYLATIGASSSSIHKTHLWVFDIRNGLVFEQELKDGLGLCSLPSGKKNGSEAILVADGPGRITRFEWPGQERGGN